MIIQPRYRKGDRIGGRYLVHQALLGGMGEVYLCLDLKQNYPIALKTFQARYLTNLDTRRLFAHEVGTWVALEKHPNIVRCFLMETLDNLPFMVLEWVAGEEGKGTDLRSWLRRGSLDLKTALDIAIDICHGLLHAQMKQPGIVHRDLKPDNILVAQGKVAKITDFGLASLVQHTWLELATDTSPGSVRQTIIGARGVVGTPPYMAPEQWLGEFCDVRTDIYAVGCILYELLTGSPPYQATTFDGFRAQHVTAPPPIFPIDGHLPEGLNLLLAGCLAKAPDARFADVATLLAFLTRLYQAQFAREPRTMPTDQEFSMSDYVNRGLTYQRLGQYDLAMADYNQALALDSTLAQAYVNRGTTYARLSQDEAALADLTQAIALDPTFAQAYYNRGLAYILLKQMEAALIDLTQAITLDPDLAQAYSFRGATYEHLGCYDAALADLTQAIALDPDLAHAYYSRGNTYHKLGQMEMALVDYTQAIALDPRDAGAYNSRGVTHRELGQTEMALTDLTQAIALDPAFVQSYYNRGTTYLQLERMEAALTDFTQVLTLDPADAQAYYNRGLTCALLGQNDVAVADYTQAIALDPSYVKAYNNRGNTYLELGQVEDALADYIRAIALDPALAPAYINLGTLLANQDRLREALPYLEQAAQLGDPQGMQYAAQVRQMLGMEPTEASN